MLILFMLLLIPVGIGMKFYKGPLEGFVNNRLAGLIYVVFWTFFAAAVWIRKNNLKLVIIIFCITCILEFTQLSHYPVLELIRSNFLGRALIGNTFSWPDFPWYAIGSILAFLWLKKIDKAYAL